jgi:hypothetical protein
MWTNWNKAIEMAMHMMEAHINIVPTPAAERNFAEKIPSFRKMPKVKNTTPKNRLLAENHEPKAVLHNNPTTNKMKPGRIRIVSRWSPIGAKTFSMPIRMFATSTINTRSFPIYIVSAYL